MKPAINAILVRTRVNISEQKNMAGRKAAEGNVHFQSRRITSLGQNSTMQILFPIWLVLFWYYWVMIYFYNNFLMKCESCTTLILINIFNKRNTFKTNLMQINNCTIMVSNENLDAKCSVQMVVTMPTCGWIARILKVSGENGSVKPNLALKARRGFVIAELLVPVTLILPSKTNEETNKT